MSKRASDKIEAWREIMRVHARVTSSLDEALRREVGIPIEWYEALVEIAFAGGTMRMNEFAEETTLTKSGATRFVDRLERAGLVERTTCATDRRVSQLALTTKGRRLQHAADPYVLAIVESEFGSRVDDDEARLIVTTLRRTHAVPAST